MTYDQDTAEGRHNWAVVRMLTQDRVMYNHCTVEDIIYASRVRGLPITEDEAKKLHSEMFADIEKREKRYRDLGQGRYCSQPVSGYQRRE